MKNTVKMKNILIGLMTVVLVLCTWMILDKHVFSKNDSEVNQTSPSAEISAAPLATSEPLIQSGSDKTSYAPITVDNVTGFSTGWSGSATDGAVNGTDEYDSKTLVISSGGTSLTSVTSYRAGVPFTQGTSYTLNFTASSDPARNIVVNLINGDTGETLQSQTINLTGTSTAYSVSFDMTQASTYSGIIQFALGSDGSSASTDYNTVYLSGIRLIPSKETIAVRVNQVGYSVNDEKRCTFSYDAGDVFDVIDTSTNQVVYSGAIVNKAKDENTGETECYGDFTNVMTPGTYIIRSQIGVSSHSFTISETPYSDLSSSMIKFLSLQRCGEDLDSSWAGAMGHLQCHNEQATIYGTSTTIDVTGGWHDAGDYGRYVKTGSKAVNDLLFAYMINPNSYDDSIGGPDSGNGTADILDEARYELEWMLKLQASDGGVYNKVLTTNVAETVTPDQDNQSLYVLDEETTSTADFAGSMAFAYIAYQQVDPEFANTCLEAAKNAYSYLDANQGLIDLTNPSDINGGQYVDDSDQDGRFTASIALWAATGDDTYLTNAKNIYNADNTAANGVSWNTNGAYGKYFYLMQSNAESADSDFYNAMKTSMKSEADAILGVAQGNGYNSSLYSYSWGSNCAIAENGVILSMEYDVSNDQTYQQAAVEQASYLLGRNSLDTCFVSGYGTVSPKNLHSRIAAANHTTLNGALVGGPDASREDTITETIDASVPSAKVYRDEWNSYSTNEATIYYNSAFIHLLSRIQ